MIECQYSYPQRMPKFKEPSQKQLAFVKYYTDPASPTYDNITQSALRAGYTEKYAKGQAYRLLKPIADRITGKGAEISHVRETATRHDRMLRKAEENLEKDLNIKDDADNVKLGIRHKTNLFVAETLGKDRYSKKTEVHNTGYNELNGVVADRLSAFQQPENLPDAPQYMELPENDVQNDDIKDIKDNT